VRSIVGRFLEHHRVYYFLNGGQEQVYCGSADWMSRNLLRRVETAFPIEDQILRARVVHEGLITYLADNTQAWELQTDGTYVRCQPGSEEPRPAQEVLLRQLSASNVAAHTQSQLEIILVRQDLLE
jgi:polyphosphate kinase